MRSVHDFTLVTNKRVSLEWSQLEFLPESTFAIIAVGIDFLMRTSKEVFSQGYKRLLIENQVQPLPMNCGK